MKKSKLVTGLIILTTLILAGVAVFTAIRLYQLRNQAVAPNVPESKPKAAGSCSLSFTLGSATATATSTATATGTATATATSTATGTATATSTATATPTTPPDELKTCNGTCTSNANCMGDFVCYNGSCRNPSCTSVTNCSCGGSAPTPTPPSLPNSGTSWPTVFGAGIGVLVIIGSLLLAL